MRWKFTVFPSSNAIQQLWRHNFVWACFARVKVRYIDMKENCECAKERDGGRVRVSKSNKSWVYAYLYFEGGKS